jgi:phasin family protein
MLQRSKTARSSRRAPAPAGLAGPEGISTEAPAAASTAGVIPEAGQPAEAGAGTVVEQPAEAAPSGAAAAAESVPSGGTPAGESVPSGASPAGESTPSGESPAGESVPSGGSPAGESLAAEAVSAALPDPTIPETSAPAARSTTMMEIRMQQANKAAENMLKAAEEAAEFGRGNVEAFTKATQIYVAGVQDLGRQTFAMVQGLADQAIENAKALSTVKSLQEAAQIQSNFARAALEKSVSETAKLGESALKLTEQTFAPITARLTLATEKLTRPTTLAV